MTRYTDPNSALPLRREHMPTDYAVSLATYTGRGTQSESRIPDNFGPRQSMRGFEETYHNIIDYIVRITHRIWEERDVDYILDCYSDKSNVYDDYGLQIGNKKIVNDTHHATGAFSNIQLIADEVVWAGNDEIGFHTSHRTLIRGTNDGDSLFGPATNQDVDVLVIANCVALENEIFLEHVCYNTSSMLRQLGYDLNDMADRLVDSPPKGWPRDPKTWNALRRSVRPVQPLSVEQPVSGFDVDRFVRNNFDIIWNQKENDFLLKNYAHDFRFWGPTDREFSGLKPYLEFYGSIIKAFPDIDAQVDEVYWMGNEKDGYLTSERWSATATHSGAGLYGVPTEREVQIWGITQHEIVNGKIVNEWMLFNELDLMMQIAAARQ